MKYEKKLVALPVPPCPELAQKQPEKIDKYKTREFLRFHAEIVTIEDSEILAVTTFTKEGKAEYRFFQNSTQWGTQVFETDEYAWRKSRKPGHLYETSVDTVYRATSNIWWSSTVLEAYSTPECRKAVYRFLRKKEGDGDPLTLLAKRQSDLRQAKIETRDERKKAALRAAFAGVDKEIPKEFEAWAEEVPLGSCRFFFYDYTGKKMQSGTCSHCLKRAELPDIRERNKGVCPHCGTKFIFYSAKRLSRSHGISYRDRAAFCVPVNENRIAVRGCQVGISLRGGFLGNIEKRIWSCEIWRVFLNGNGLVTDTYCNPEGTTKIYLDNLCECRYSSYSPSDLYIAPMHLQEIRKRMGIYAPLEVLADHGFETTPHKLFTAPRKNAHIEYLIKMGLYGLADNEFHTDEKHPVLLEGKKPHEILGVSPELLPLLKEADPSAKAFLAIRALHKDGIKLTVRDMQDIDALHLGWRQEDKLCAMAEGSSIHKALKYIAKQARIYDSDGTHVIQEWGDYCAMAKAIGINLGDHCALFPKNLRAAHVEAAKIQEYRENEKLNRRMEATAMKLQDLCWRFNGLMIRPALNHAELFEEGKYLDHCVGRMGYAEKQAEGKTAIFFIRKEKEPEISYVTLELDLKRWEKIQCYGAHDHYPGAQVSNFVNRWIKEIVKPARVGATEKVKIAV